MSVSANGCGSGAPSRAGDDELADREAPPPARPVFTLYAPLAEELADTPGLLDDARALFGLEPGRVVQGGRLVQERIAGAHWRTLVTYGKQAVQTIDVARCEDVVSACASGEALAVLGNFVAADGVTELAPPVRAALAALSPLGEPLLDARDYFERGFSARTGWVGRTGAEYRLLDASGQILQRLKYPNGDVRRPVLVTYVPELVQTITGVRSSDGTASIVNSLQLGSTTTLR